MATLRELEFLTTVAQVENLPPARGAEVAFAGRSNAGKSSAINALAEHNRLAFVSKTPGRTQHLNFFSLGDERYLVDLPGYGYAAVARDTRRRWNKLIEDYLQARTTLRGIVLIMDARHPLTSLDRQLLAWLAPSAIPVHVLLSKADKLGHEAQLRTLGTVRSELAPGGHTAQLFSSLRKIGIVEAAVQIRMWLDGDRNKKPPVKGE